MKKTELKQLIKPMVKECIHEILLEEGLLSNVVSEVAKGIQQSVIVETKQPQRTKPRPDERQQLNRKANESRSKLKEYRSNLMSTIGDSAYNGVNLFEGTEPIQESKSTQGAPDLGNPSDAGVDISSIIGNSSAIWQTMK